MIEIEHLSFQYGDTPVFKDISFQAKPGEITSIIGPNGTGKTTMLRCIAGLRKGQGTVKVLGEELTQLSRVKISELIGYLEQSTDCSAELNVFEVILLGRLNQLSFRISEEDTALVQKYMKLLNISQFADRKISELSGGQRQLVFIAQTLIKRPEILILDEPTSALDMNRQFMLMEFVRKITKEEGYTTLVTVHHLDIAARYSDQVVVLDEGKVYQVGRAEEVFSTRMLREVYKVDSELYFDKKKQPHIVALGPI